MSMITSLQWRRVKMLLVCAAGLHVSAYFLPVIGDSSGTWLWTAKPSWRYWLQLLNDFYFDKSRAVRQEDLIMLFAWLANPLFWVAMAAFFLEKWMRLPVIGGVASLLAIAILAVTAVASYLQVRL